MYFLLVEWANFIEDDFIGISFVKILKVIQDMVIIYGLCRAKASQTKFIHS